MTWHVIEFMDNNPGATTSYIINHFASELEVNDQIKYLREEVDIVLTIREKLRPLYGKKMELDRNLALLDSEFEMEVMIKYPPRKGSEKERKAYKTELQNDNSDFLTYSGELDSIKDEISELETEMNDVEQRAKNARRLLETFNKYMGYVLDSVGGDVKTNTPSSDETVNSDVF